MAELGHPDRDLERTELDYERLKVDLENQEILLATARVNLQRAEDEFQRTKQLFEAQVVSERVYQLAARTKEGFEVEVRQREGLVKDLSARLETRKAQIDWERQLTELQRERVASNQLEIALLSTNMVLSAPIDGSITAIYRRAGEVVQPGDPIVSISSAKAEQILCYLRQPLPLEPRRGMQVRVRTRSLPRQEGWAEIVSVGSQMELVAAALRHPGMTTEIGLPVAVSLPLGVSLRPGELVDLSILPNGRRTSTALASRTR
jgi:multidrug resistance efflux pump